MKRFGEAQKDHMFIHLASQRKMNLTLTCTLIVLSWVSLASAAGPAKAEDKPDFPGEVRLILPKVIPAVPGIESNVYFENVCLMLNPANYAVDVRSPKGVQWQDRWAYTPQDDESGDYPLVIEVRDASNKVVARGSTVVHVVLPQVESEGFATVLLIGASWTQAGIYPQQVFDQSIRDPYVLLKFIGSRGPNNLPPSGEVRFEGYNGWTAQAFATFDGPLSRSGYFKRPETGSPFVYKNSAGKFALDFKRYCDEFNAGFGGPDFVTISLGTNDTFSSTDENIDQSIDTMLGYYDQLIAMIHKVRPTTKIGVSLIPPPSASQDGFRNYNGARKQTRWQSRRNSHRLVERLARHYGSREREHIYLLPVYLNLDTVSNYPTATTPRSMYSAEKIDRVTNGTHPADAGYKQMGDVIFCWIKSELERAAELKKTQLNRAR
jgi:lysophospholipase L1-like esterase